ncbi:hypothetical protein GCM10008022_27580 [Paenibacillus hunanensis]|nr:hypothetical protein GCM10008022_27580 [Paenibacillus hunanensis]
MEQQSNRTIFIALNRQIQGETSTAGVPVYKLLIMYSDIAK